LAAEQDVLQWLAIDNIMNLFAACSEPLSQHYYCTIN
jgi:hypothetical protein